MRFLSTASKTNETREKTREREDASDEEVDAGEPYIGAPDIAARAAIEPEEIPRRSTSDRAGRSGYRGIALFRDGIRKSAIVARI